MLDNLPTSRFVVNTRKEGVTAPSFDRKEEILEIATELLQARSFSSFSYADLSARLGISKASIHHHFPTKEAMARALVQRFRASNRQLLVDLDRQHKDPWQRLEIFLGCMCALADSGSKICPMGCLRVEHNVIGDSIRDELHQHYQLVHGWLVGLLEVGRAKGQMTFPATPDAQAVLIYAAMQGALQNARAQGPDQSYAVAAQLKAMMKPATT